MEILVNLSSGNLVITQDDFTLKGTGQDLAISHVYNNLVPNSGSLGVGMTLSLGADVGLEFSGSNVILHGPSNYCATYTPNGSGGYTAPSGMNAQLRKESDGSFTLTFDSSEEKWRFTPHGWLTSQGDRNGNANTFYYNKLGNLYSIVDSQDRVTTVDSNAVGLVTKITDPTGEPVASYEYNSNNQMTSFVDRNGHTVKIEWDGAWNLVSITDPSNNVYCFAYDGSDRVTKVSVPNSAKPLDTTFEYQSGRTVQRDPKGNATTYHFDGEGRQTKAVDALGHEQGAQTIGYDTSGRQTSISVKNPAGAETFKATYNYAVPGGGDSDLVQSKTIAGVTTAFTYDPLRRLTKAGNDTFGYDLANNMTNLAGTSFTMNAANQAIQAGNSTNTFDGAGNLTSRTNPSETYNYSPTNQLVSATNGGTEVYRASYDGIDQTQPRSITEKSATHVFGQTALGPMWVKENGSLTTYSRDPDGLVMTVRTGNGTRYNAITDYQGSVLGLVDTKGNLAATYTYTPYGASTASGTAAAANNLRYLGQYQTQRGELLFGYRYYNPNWGRFTQPDPTGQERNPYTYAQNDPINNSDPTGDLSRESAVLLGLGVIAAGLSLATFGSTLGLFTLSTFTKTAFSFVSGSIGLGNLTIRVACAIKSGC